MFRGASRSRAIGAAGVGVPAIVCALAATCSVYTADLTATGGEGASGPTSTASSSSSSSSSSSTASTGGGGSGAGGSGGGGGMGGAGGCQSAAQCPDTMNECVKPVCNAGQCGTMNVADGTKTVGQTA